MRLYLRLLFCVTAITSGCATYHAKPISPAQTALDFESRSLTDPALRQFVEKNLRSSVNPWPPMVWDFNLLTLAAFYYHPDLDVARAQRGVAQAAQTTAGEKPNPALTTSAEYATNEPAGTSPWVAGFSLDIPIETAGKRGYRRQQSQALTDSAQSHLVRVAWGVRSRVRASLLVFSAAVRNEAILRAQQAQLNENETFVEERARSGFVSPLVRTQAEVLAGRNAVSLQDAESQVQLARAQLADALGLSNEALEGVRLSTSSFDQAPLLTPEALQNARRNAVQNRSDLRESLNSYAASQSALQLEIAKQYPDIHLGPGYLFDQGVSRWGLTLLEALPIFNRNRGAILEAVARRKETASRFLALQNQVIGEIDRAIIAYHAAARKLETANRLLANHERQERQLRRLLRPGDVSRLTLFRSQLDIDSTRLIASDALTQFQQTAGALEDALEQPLPANVPNLQAVESDPRGDH